MFADLKGPKIKNKLHYGWCTGRRFTAATLHNTSCSEDKENTNVRSFKSNEHIRKKVDGPYFEVSAKKASSVTL